MLRLPSRWWVRPLRMLRLASCSSPWPVQLVLIMCGCISMCPLLLVAPTLSLLMLKFSLPSPPMCPLTPYTLLGSNPLALASVSYSERQWLIRWPLTLTLLMPSGSNVLEDRLTSLLTTPAWVKLILHLCRFLARPIRRLLALVLIRNVEKVLVLCRNSMPDRDILF